jgi:hypothetical protein
VQNPEVMVIHVKRFRSDGSKITGHMEFAERVEIAEETFSLVAVAMHEGWVWSSTWFHCVNRAISIVPRKST